MQRSRIALSMYNKNTRANFAVDVIAALIGAILIVGPFALLFLT